MVHRAVKAYAIGGQKSFYECWMAPSEYRDLLVKIKLLIVLNSDRVHIFRLDPRRKMIGLGIAQQPKAEFFIIA